jgi:hypothetical protein
MSVPLSIVILPQGNSLPPSTGKTAPVAKAVAGETKEITAQQAAEKGPSAVTHLRWATHFQWVPGALGQRCSIRTQYASHLAG